MCGKVWQSSKSTQGRSKDENYVACKVMMQPKTTILILVKLVLRSFASQINSEPATLIIGF